MHKFRLRETAYGAVLAQHVYNRAALEADLGSAFRRGELTLFYQPIMSARTEMVVGAEALLRWQHESLGMLTPMGYLRAIDDGGCGKEIARWAITRAIRDGAQINAHAPLTINVNLSPTQLLALPLAEIVASELRAARLAPHLLTIEVTEHAVVRNPVAALHAMQQLKSLGVMLALDDFGTGYNGLAQLQSYPLDCVKLDRRFVVDVARSPASKVICSSMIMLAHSLGIRVIAEGVETFAQVSALRSLGCDAFQGFYYSPAVTKTAFVRTFSKPGDQT